MVEMNLESMDLPGLKRIYSSANLRFQQALLNGAEWQELQGQRELIVELAVAIQRKEPSFFYTHPAADARGRMDPSGPEHS
jgi:hypothetical protein